MELIELGIPGSNQYVVRRFFEWFLNQEKLSDTFVVVGGQILIGICGGIIRNLNGLTIQIKYILKIQKDSMKIILFTNGHIKKGKNTKILWKWL